jgi:ElaA protein
MAAPSEVATVTSLPKIVPGITTQWRRYDELSAAALYELLRLRQQVFVVEQRSPYADLDGLDEAAHHLLLRAGVALAGCLRLLAPSEPAAVVRLGRVAVAAGLRGHGLGRRLMAEALSHCRLRHPGRPIALSAQLYLVRFYEGFGFAPAGAPFDDCGVPHIDMRLVPRSPAQPRPS